MAASVPSGGNPRASAGSFRPAPRALGSRWGEDFGRRGTSRSAGAAPPAAKPARQGGQRSCFAPSAWVVLLGQLGRCCNPPRRTRRGLSPAPAITGAAAAAPPPGPPQHPSKASICWEQQLQLRSFPPAAASTSPPAAREGGSPLHPPSGLGPPARPPPQQKSPLLFVRTRFGEKQLVFQIFCPPVLRPGAAPAPLPPQHSCGEPLTHLHQQGTLAPLPTPAPLGGPPTSTPGPWVLQGGSRKPGGCGARAWRLCRQVGGDLGSPKLGELLALGSFPFPPPRATSPPAVPQLGSGLALARGGFFGVFFFFFSLPACNFPSHAPALSRARSLHAPPLLQSHPPHLSSAAG